MCVTIMEKGEFFGILDASNQRNYTTSVKCTSAVGSCFMIGVYEFFKQIYRDDQIWKKLVSQLRGGDIYTSSKIKSFVETKF